MRPYSFNMRSLIIFLSLLWTMPLWANQDDCSKVDLTQKFGAIRNQGSSDHCYAFAAADLLGAETGLKTPDKISALDLISSYINLRDEEFNLLHKKIKYENVPINNLGVHTKDILTTGKKVTAKGKGYTDLALAKALNDGRICLEREIPSQSIKYSEIPDLDFLVDYRISQLSKSPSLNRLNENLATKPKASCTPLVKTNDLMLQEIVPSINDWATAKLRESVKAICKNPISLKKLDVHSALFFEEQDKETSKRTMNKLLSNGHGFILNYNRSILETGKTPPRAQLIDHSSVVTGRRWNSKKNRCEIQIRNSGGPDCSNKAADVDCKNGHFWVSQELIADSFHEVVYLTPPSDY